MKTSGRKQVVSEGYRFLSICNDALLACCLLLLALSLSSCGRIGPAPIYEGYGPAPPGYYRVRRGDTLYRIATRHKLGYKTLAHWNKLAPPYRIYAGSLLRMRPPGTGASPSANREARASAATTRSTTKSATPVDTANRASKPSGDSSAKASSRLRWQWPLKGRLVKGFRSGDLTRQGIRIAGRPGQKVLAAEAGTVVYSGSGLKGYGDLIIVKHNDSYLSAYGFNRRRLVSEGARVKRGQVVAEVGQASNGQYRLHFEIRKNGTAVDPLKYLP